MIAAETARAAGGRGRAAPAGSGRAAQRGVAPFMLVAVGALLLGLWAGLARIGWDLPAADGNLMLRHGGLMVVGFVATVIAVERAVAVRNLPAFAAPALSGAAGLALIFDAPGRVPAGLATASGVAYSVNVAVLLYRHRLPHFGVALAGALCFAVAGAVWWRGDGYPSVVPWWMAFLVLTIAAERLDIVRFQRISAVAAAAGLLAAALIVLGPVVGRADRDAGAAVQGLGFIAGVLWLVRRDVAVRTVHTDGLARFSAVGVLAAAAWLAMAGAFLVAWGQGLGGLHYDAVVHAFFIGFVFGAIIAHEPIIAPAVTGLPFVYTPLMFVPLTLLDAGLLARIAADLGDWADVRRWAGMVQAIAILAFLGTSVFSLWLGSRQRARRRHRPPEAS
jgi:hypothetical protein